MIKVITWNSHGLLYHRNLGVIIVNGRSISNLKKFGSCISKPCIQDTLSSRVRLAFRPSASREQKYLAYNSKPRVPNLLLFKKFAPEKFYLKQWSFWHPASHFIYKTFDLNIIPFFIYQTFQVHSFIISPLRGTNRLLIIRFPGFSVDYQWVYFRHQLRASEIN